MERGGVGGGFGEEEDIVYKAGGIERGWVVGRSGGGEGVGVGVGGQRAGTSQPIDWRLNRHTRGR